MIKELAALLKKDFPLLTYRLMDGAHHFYIGSKYTNVSLHDGDLGNIQEIYLSLKKEIYFYKDKKDPEKYVEEKIIKRGNNGNSTVSNGSPARRRSRNK